jgi:hypothetical protein
VNKKHIFGAYLFAVKCNKYNNGKRESKAKMSNKMNKLMEEGWEN